jgi:hypothetical protein
VNQKINANLQSQIHNQLMEQGAFTPLDLLLFNGRLAYSDYESWRAGEIEFLDQAFLGSPKRIDTLLQQAVAYAQTIGLVSETQDFPGMNPGGQPANLRISADKTRHEQISLRFVSKRDSPQLDMFFDNPVVVLTNNVVDALVHRSFADAQHYLDKLYQQAPNHADLAAFDLLVETVRLADKPVNDPLAELQKLEQISPHAKRLLSNRSRDFLVRQWRALAEALEGTPFSETNDKLHNSYVLAQAQDWPGVSQAVQDEPTWWKEQVLCLRLAESGYLRHSRSESLTAWCYLCWHSPEKVTALLDSRQWIDPNTIDLWDHFCSLEEQLDLDEPVPTQDFPAWLLLYEPGLIHSLDQALLELDPGPATLYAIVHQLLVAHQTGETGRELTMRKELQSRQPALLRYFKSTL